MSKKAPQSKGDSKFQDAIRELVLARVKATPRDVRISVGSSEYTRDELIENIERGSEVGHDIEEIQMEYLRDLASGRIYGER